MPLMDDLDKLRAELALLKTQQGTHQAQLEEQLAHFSLRLEALSGQILAQSDVQASTTATTEEPSTYDLSPQYAAVPSASQHQLNPWTNDPVGQQPSATVPKPQKAAKQNALGAILSQSSTGIAQLTSVALVPLAELTAHAKGFYRHYQAKGLGPVFLMTIAGIITLTLGFGYLLQFSINNWFSELGKALLGLGVANTIIAGGIFIRQKRPGMEDFGSGLVGLGLIINYLCLYFIGPYFNLVPESVSFGLLLLNTIFGYLLAFKLDTKIIALVALLGGSLAPLMLLDNGHTPLLYLPYLLLIGLCSLIQGHKLAWPVLIEITAILHIACVQVLSAFIQLPFDIIDWQTIIALLSVHGLFYLYGIGSLQLFTRKTLTPRLMAVPIALLAFILYILSEFGLYAGELFILNAFLCFSLYWISQHRINKQDKDIASLALAFAASFAGFAALYLLSSDLLGLVLLLEGLLLLWVGCKQQFSAIRAEAYLLLALGIMSSFTHMFDVLTSVHYNDANTWQYQTILSLSMVLTCAMTYLSQRLLTQFKASLEAVEIRLIRISQDILSLLYSVTLVLIAFFISEQYYLNTLPLIGILLLYLSAKHRLRVSEVLAWVWQLPLLGLVLLAILDANSLSFTDQALNAKLGRVELFASLLLAYYWYKKHYADSKLIKFAYYAQLICYLTLPLLLLPKVLRSFPDYLAIALWFSSVVSIGLAYLVKQKSLNYEAQVLTVLATLTTAIFCLAQLWQGLVALALGLALMGFVVLRYAYLPTKWQQIVKFQWHLSPYYFALTLAVLSQTLSNLFYPNWAVTAAILCGYFCLLTEPRYRLGGALSKALRPSYSLAYMAIFITAILPIVLHSETRLALDLDNLLLSLAELTILTLLGWYLLSTRLGIRIHEKILPLNALNWGWHGLLSISYLHWSYQLSPSFAAPMSAILMIIHASIVMLISLRPRQASMIRLAATLFALACMKVVFVDMASFELVQKVVAFMLIGIILLTVAYFYQRAKNRIELMDSAIIE